MKTSNSFDCGLKIVQPNKQENYYGPCKWHDDNLVEVEGDTLTIYTSAKSKRSGEDPLIKRTLLKGTEVFITDGDYTYEVGTV